MRDGVGGTTAPCSVTSASWTVASFASDVRVRRSAVTAASSSRAAARRAVSVARCSAVRSGEASCAESRAIRVRSAVTRRASASICSWRSSICTCWATIVPSEESRVIASCTASVGTRRTSDALPSSAVAYETDTT